jgi:hypothetical protein
MADFALWAAACETAMWPAGTFWSAYCGNRDEAVEGVIDADPVAVAVRTMMAARTVRTEKASDLLGALAESVSERVAKSKSWPDTPRALAGRLRRAAPFLRKIGIEISFEREGHARTRLIRIEVVSPPEYAGNFASAPSAPSAQIKKSSSNNDLEDLPLRTQNSAADANADGADANEGDGNATVRTSVGANPLETKTADANADDADYADAKIPTLSAPEKTAGWRMRI